MSSDPVRLIAALVRDRINLPNLDDFDRARDWLNRFETGSKAGDAPHLAIASNRAADAIHSLDKRMIAAGERLGLPASTGVHLPGYGK